MKLKFITNENFTSLDFDSRLLGHDTSFEAIEYASTYQSECRRCGTPCKVSIRDNKTKKTYPLETFERIYGK